jgi:hypothetical protein
MESAAGGSLPLLFPPGAGAPWGSFSFSGTGCPFTVFYGIHCFPIEISVVSRMLLSFPQLVLLSATGTIYNLYR